VDPAVIARELDREWFTVGQLQGVRKLSGRSYDRIWALRRDLAAASPEWTARPRTKLNRIYNKELDQKFAFLEQAFRILPEDEDWEEPETTPGAPDAGGSAPGESDVPPEPQR
jgi:hypothetical protein